MEGTKKYIDFDESTTRPGAPEMKVVYPRSKGFVGRLPWKVYVLPAFVVYVAAYISSIFKGPDDGLVIYLPISLSIVLVHWWGPRILPAVYVATVVRHLIVVGLPADVGVMLINETHVAFTAFASWILFAVFGKGKCWLPDKESVLKFTVFGILFPVSINASYELLVHEATNMSVWENIFFIWTSDFASSCAIALPAMYFLTPVLQAAGLACTRGGRLVEMDEAFDMIRKNGATLIALASSLVILSSLLPLQKYWFVLGVFVVLISIRFGFAYALLANLLVFILTYLRPFIFSDSPGIQDVTSGMLEIHQGMCLLALTAGITGRVVSDLRNADTQLSQQIDELRQTHSELDRFVYSTSHDLSAPLKSIQGLINISRIEKNEGEKSRHLDRIERSVQKLERFIGEIQEYARNSRLEVKAEPLSLSTLVEQVIDNHRHLENFERIKFTIEKTKGDTIVADQMRLLLILNNLISNAIQFHKVEEPNRPQVTIHSELSRSFILVHIEDNGEGIREDIITHIFNMFYRGTPKSTGSGLGLFIAKEAAEKMGGSITVKSVYGTGSVFTLHLPRRST